jgi:hypothetical protein
LPASSVSALSNRHNSVADGWMSPLGLSVNTGFDDHQASAWRQRYEDAERANQELHRWGLTGVDYERARMTSSASLGNDLFGQMQNRQVSQVESRATSAYKRDKNLQTAARIMAPAAVVYGIYSGEPLNLRLTDSTLMFVRTELGFVGNDLRFKTGSLGVNSPVVNTRFDYRPWMADSRDPGILAPGSLIAPGAALGAGAVASLSWWLLARPHMYEHPHINAIVLYLAALPMAYVCLAVAFFGVHPSPQEGRDPLAMTLL